MEPCVGLRSSSASGHDHIFKTGPGFAGRVQNPAVRRIGPHRLWPLASVLPRRAPPFERSSAGDWLFARGKRRLRLSHTMSSSARNPGERRLATIHEISALNETLRVSAEELRVASQLCLARSTALLKEMNELLAEMREQRARLHGK